MKKFAVIGHPVAHSLSPKMHTANMASIGFEIVTDRGDVKRTQAACRKQTVGK